MVAFRLELVVAFRRNQWSPSTGIAGRLRAENAEGTVDITFDDGNTPFEGQPEFNLTAQTTDESKNTKQKKGSFPFKVKVKANGTEKELKGTVKLADLTPPSFGPPQVGVCASQPCVAIPVQDDGSGLASILVTQAQNVSVLGTDGFPSGTNDVVVVTAIKQREGESSRVQLAASDVAGNRSLFDPVLAQIGRVAGKPLHETYAGLLAAEHVVTIYNGDPGLQKLEIVVNGRTFWADGLVPGRTTTLDVSSAMIPGDKNIVVVKAVGRPGGSAMLMIWDGR